MQTDNNIVSEFVIDTLFYSSEQYYPLKLVDTVSVQKYCDVNLAYVQIRPIQYNPKNKKIRCYSKLKYRITYSSDYSLNVRNNHKILNNVVSNPQHLLQLPKNNRTINDEVKYIILTIDQYEQAANTFANWKTMLGYKTKVLSKQNWTASQVKDSVHAIYSRLNAKPEYLLILGDHEDVPAEEFSNSGRPYVTDLYYVCMDGNNDFTPEMAYGRIPVNSLEQAYIVIDKIIKYEKKPIDNSSFYQTALHCAQFQDDNNDGYEDRRFVLTSEEIRDYVNGHGKNINRVYYAENTVIPMFYNNGSYSNGQPIPYELRKDVFHHYPWNGNNIDITNEINSGRFYVLHRDHGSYNGWFHPNFSISDISNLTNKDKLPIVFSMNCQTGGFNQPECFAEKLLRHDNGGAVGVIAATQISYSGFNDALSVGIFDAIWPYPGLVPNFGNGTNPNVNQHSYIYNMGYVLNQAKIRMKQTYGQYSYQDKIFHYFGDPSMEIYTSNPSSFNNVSISTNGSSVIVNTGSDQCKIVLCSIMDMGESYHNVVDGVSSYTFSNITPSYYLTIAKHNYKPFIYAYVQNNIFSSNTSLSGLKIFIGRNVNPASTQGDVVVENGASVILDADEDVHIEGGFEIGATGSMEIR